MSSRFSAWSSTTSTRAISADRQRDGECAAGAQRAVHQNAAAEELGQLLADVQAEPGALEFPGFRLADLFEGPEQPVLVVIGDAEARVDDAHLNRAPVLGHPQRQRDAASLGELDGVVGQVYQNLGACPPVGADRDVLAEGVDRELQALALDQRPERL